MKVILTENLKGIGRIGDVKNVSDGYARNFLFPKKLAKLASDGAMKEVESLKKKVAQTQELEKENAAQGVEKLKDVTLEFKKKASKMGKLYSSVTKRDISTELSKFAGFKFEPEMIDLGDHGEHIKKVGEHLIEVNLSSEVKLQIKVVIKSE